MQGFRQQAMQVRDSEVERSLKALANGTDPKQALEQLAASLTNKLIHPTTAAIRDASADGRSDRLDFIQQTYGLNPSSSKDDDDDKES